MLNKQMNEELTNEMLQNHVHLMIYLIESNILLKGNQQNK